MAKAAQAQKVMVKALHREVTNFLKLGGVNFESAKVIRDGYDPGRYPDAAVAKLRSAYERRGEVGQRYLVALDEMAKAPKITAVQTAQGASVSAQGILERCGFQPVDSPDAAVSFRGERLLPLGVNLSLQKGAVPLDLGKDVNKASQAIFGKDAIYWPAFERYPGVDVPLAEPLQVQHTFLVEGTAAESGSEQRRILSDKGMTSPEVWLNALAAGLNRIFSGVFPKDAGSRQDPGDAFQGLYSRAGSSAARSRVLPSDVRGVHDFSWSDGYAYGRIFAAGLRNLKP